MSKLNKLKKIITALVLALVLLISGQVFLPANLLYAKADEPAVYTDVLEDLKRDSKFKISDYPSMTVDYFKSINNDDTKENDQLLIEFLTIAESVNGELFIYTYQPLSNDFNTQARAISISLGFSKDGRDLNPKPYNLSLISNETVFYKYLVKDLTVSDVLCRYYNFVSIYCDYITGFDSIIPGCEINGNQRGIPVGQQWSAHYEKSGIVYSSSTFETMEIKVQFTGSFLLYDGIKFGSLFGWASYGDLWFISFNCDEYIIEHIYNADMSYTKTHFEYKESALNGSYLIQSSPEDVDVTLIDTNEVFYSGDGLLHKDFLFNEISTAASFLKDAQDQGVEDISDECITALNNSQWVFVFALTDYAFKDGLFKTKESYWDVSDVTILRIEFLDINGDVYNLGVVADRVNPDNIADGVAGLDLDFLKILALLFLIFILVLFGPFLSPIFTVVLKILGKLLTLLLKLIWKLLTFPFRLFRRSRIRKRKR